MKADDGGDPDQGFVQKYLPFFVTFEVRETTGTLLALLKPKRPTPTPKSVYISVHQWLSIAPLRSVEDFEKLAVPPRPDTPGIFRLATVVNEIKFVQWNSHNWRNIFRC